MKILIDCSNLQVGGGIQVATSFINDLNILNLKVKFYVVLSPQMKNSFNRNYFSGNITFEDILPKDHKSIFKRSKVLIAIEKRFNPDKVFCVFGPSYYKSSAPKIVGYAIPHYIYRDSPFFENLTLILKLKSYIYRKLRVFLFKRNANILVFETDDARNRFSKYYSFPIEKAVVFNNTLNEVFLNKHRWIPVKYKIKGQYKILCLGANYRHKNLRILPKVIDRILEEGKIKDFVFVLSQTKSELNFEEKYHRYIQYLGRVELEKLPSLYGSVDILFMPTLLEVFSATYLEAMYTETAIVTSDLGFARDICGKAAEYFIPNNISDAARGITEVLLNKEYKESLEEQGRIRVSKYASSMDRTKGYLKLLNDITLN